MNSNLMNKKNIIICLLGISVVIGLFFTFKNNKENDPTEYDKQARIVKNFNDFYSICNCVNKYINYVNKKDTKAILSLLSDKYKKDNNINQDNVLSVINVEPNSVFIAKKMLYKYVDDSEYKYYIKGIQGQNNITMNSNFDESKAKDMYYIVYTKETSKENIFSIEPYDGKEFLNEVER